MRSAYDGDALALWLLGARRGSDDATILRHIHNQLRISEEPNSREWWDAVLVLMGKLPRISRETVTILE